MKKREIDKKVWLVGGGLAVLALGQVWVSNRLVTRGVEVSGIVRELGELKGKNWLMRQELSGKGAMMNVAVEAEGMGFESVKEVVYIEGGLPVAERLVETGE